MTFPAQRRLLVSSLMLLAAIVFFTGIRWGLPSRQVDPYLFGDHPVWTGEQIMQLAGERRDDPHLGANVPQHLLQHRDQIITLNETDEQRAEIIRRYRLYSCQPDENTLLMALARMKPSKGDLDPKFYQYGGLFVYPVGALLKLAGVFHVIKITPSVAYYIDHPEEFGRFYVVARALPAAWGVAGVWAVFWIARRLSNGLWIPAAATIAYIFLPVDVNMAHEAKPHLPGAVLMLLAVIAACRYVETGARRYAIGAGLLCGAAFGTVLSAALIFILLPIMTLLRPDTWKRRFYVLAVAATLGVLTYFATNPYVVINLLRNRAVLQSNLANSTGMYRFGPWSQSIPTALRLIREGATPGLALAGALGLAVSLASWRSLFRRTTPPGGRPALLVLLIAPSLLILLQFISLADHKPAEYARFALFPDIVLAMIAITFIAQRIRSCWVSTAIIVALLATTFFAGLRYLSAFIRDEDPHNSRLAAADLIRSISDGDSNGDPASVAIWAEPAPYALPPLNLFRTRLFLLPLDYIPSPNHPPAELLIRAEDSVPAQPEPWAAGYERFSMQHGRPARISWADKPFVIYAAPATRPANRPPDRPRDRP